MKQLPIIGASRFLGQAIAGTTLLTSAMGCVLAGQDNIVSDTELDTTTSAAVMDPIRVRIPKHVLPRLDIANALSQILVSKTAMATYLKSPKESLRVLGLDPSVVNESAMTDVVKDLSHQLGGAMTDAYSNTKESESVGQNRNGWSGDKSSYERQSKETFAEKNFHRDSVGRDYENHVLEWAGRVDLMPLLRPGAIEKIAAADVLRRPVRMLSVAMTTVDEQPQTGDREVFLRAHHIRYWDICRLVGDLAANESLWREFTSKISGHLSDYGLSVEEVNVNFVMQLSENLRNAYGIPTSSASETNIDGLPPWIRVAGLLDELTQERLEAAVRRP